MKIKCTTLMLTSKDIHNHPFYDEKTNRYSFYEFLAKSLGVDYDDIIEIDRHKIHISNNIKHIFNTFCEHSPASKQHLNDKGPIVAPDCLPWEMKVYAGAFVVKQYKEKQYRNTIVFQSEEK